MTGVEVAAGVVAAWAWRKARRVGTRADAEIDNVIDAAMRRLYDLVTSRAGGHPAVRLLEAEATFTAADPAAMGPAVRPEVQRAAGAAIAQVAASDPAFSAEVRYLVAQLPPSAVRASVAGDHNVLLHNVVTGPRSRMTVGGSHSRTYKIGFGLVGAFLILAVFAVLAVRYLPVYLYQRQVLAACAEAEAITSENHNEALRFVAPGPDGLTPGGASTPTDLIRVDKAGLLRVLADRTARVSAVFNDLGQRSTPGSLTTEKAAVDRAFGQWMKASTAEAELVRTGLKDNMTLTAAMKTPFFVDSKAAVAGTNLNTAMAGLAGRACTAIASGPPVAAE
ncbi:hypothetical protein [Micromonospora sp. NPDC092111]|uniref:hypothetical protein n=1 Tax=Micromonospora sp. NPDC092111 TaxID=3364289 RepID=UPI0038136E87